MASGERSSTRVGTRRTPFEAATLSRVLPFGVFMFFIFIEESLRLVARHGGWQLSEVALYYLYPVKTVAVTALLWKYRAMYREIRLADLWQGRTLAVIATGIVTCVLWVWMDWAISVTGATRGFVPSLLPGGAVRIAMTATRIAGAVLVVPLMEELFWRSFLLRYLIDADFESVPVGRFTWASFLITTVLFGLEHQLMVAGMVAGAIYNIVLYRTRSLAHCVLAHAVTNLTLACYVLYSGRWEFW